MVEFIIINVLFCYFKLRTFIYSGSDAVVKYLLEVDQSSSLAKAENGSTPAHYAAIYGQLSTLKLLLQSGSSLQNDVAMEKDIQGLTVLHLASLKGDEQVRVQM